MLVPKICKAILQWEASDAFMTLLHALFMKTPGIWSLFLKNQDYLNDVPKIVKGQMLKI